VDAVRGSVAIERGPLVYCLEGVDHPGRRLDDLTVDVAGPIEESLDRVLADVVVIEVEGATRSDPDGSWWPYLPGEDVSPGGEPVRLRAVPYFTWGNRADGAMRVWLPTS
ncbi:MAG: hypothetical protein ACRYG2_38950, partial [Janthinobacterium lividum]